MLNYKSITIRYTFNLKDNYYNINRSCNKFFTIRKKYQKIITTQKHNKEAQFNKKNAQKLSCKKFHTINKNCKNKITL